MEAAAAQVTGRGVEVQVAQKAAPRRAGPEPEWEGVGDQRLERLGARNVPTRGDRAHRRRSPSALATRPPARSRPHTVADEFPVGRAGVVEGAVELIEVAERLLGVFAIEPLLAPEQRVDRVLLIVEPRDRRSQLLGSAAVAPVQEVLLQQVLLVALPVLAVHDELQAALAGEDGVLHLLLVE